MTQENKYFKVVLSIVLFLIMSGCVTQKNLEYMQAKDKNIREYKAADIEDYKLKSSDELYITITSLDEVNANAFSNGGTQQTFTSSSIQPYGASLVAYTINKEGYLLLPVVGSIFVKDKTLSEVSIMLKDSLNNVLNQPLVTVKLVNRYVSVLGEVKFPGHFTYSQDKLSIYDAIGLAGDMTIYANRAEVVLSRNENGKNIIIRLDLTKPQILESSYYYIRPNDMIYIMPMRKRIWGLSEFPFSVVLSALSVTLLFYSVVKP